MSDDGRGPEQYRTRLSTASTILGLTLFTAFCISICIRQYLIATNRRAWPWSFRRGSQTNSVERRISSSEDEPRTIAIGGRAKDLRIPLMWDAYLQTGGLLPLTIDKTEENTVKCPLANLQPISIEMLTPHTAGSCTPDAILHSPAPVTPPPPPRGVLFTLYPQGALPTPRFQQQASPRNAAPATPHVHTSVHISFSSAPTPASLNPQESPAPNPSELPPDPPLTSTLAPHPLQLTFLITFPDPSFPTHLPPPASSHPSPPTASSVSPTFGILNPPPTFLLPSLTVPAESLTRWWDLPDEAVPGAGGNRALGWEFRLREVQEARERIRRRQDVAFALQRHGRAIGRRV